MAFDRDAAVKFVWSAARLVDRYRYSLLFEQGAPEPVLAALAAYRNEDGGFGHGLEPDLRAPSSQPAATLYALETLVECAAVDGDLGRGLRTWLAATAEEDGGIPFALAGFEEYPHSPWWAPEPGSFLTFSFAALLHGAGVTGDEWLARASDWCWSRIEQAENLSGYVLKYVCQFLDSVPDGERANSAIERIAEQLDPASLVPVGGAEGETLKPLDLSPRPGLRSRALVSDSDVQGNLDALEAEQQPDGGWMFDWLAWAPAQTTDWRGIVTIRSLLWLRDNGRM